MQIFGSASYSIDSIDVVDAIVNVLLATISAIEPSLAYSFSEWAFSNGLRSCDAVLVATLPLSFGCLAA